jgi:GMP synthase-like glutamine amidotransferase
VTAAKKEKVLFFAHSDDRDPGTTTEFLGKKNIDYQIHHWGGLKPLPDLSEYSGLIILGGSQMVDEESIYPWLVEEKQAIRDYLKMDRPILGICLGGQLLAEILGADVRRHDHPEVGWKVVHLDPSASPLIPEACTELKFFQWHSYRFLTPKVAKQFATNDITKDQGFVYRHNVVATQFHPEATAAWVKECSEDTTYPNGHHVEPGEKVRAQLHLIEPMKTWYFQLLDRLF